MRIRGFAPSTPCWAELTTVDPAAAAGFYTELFGWDLADDVFRLDGDAVAGLNRTEPGRSGPDGTGPGGTGPGGFDGWVTYLATDDLPATVERICGAYGRNLTQPQERAGSRSVIVADAAGAAFGLWQSTGFAGARLRGEPGAMAWPDLLTDDVAAATSFYGAVFGWLLTDEFGCGEWLTEAHDSVAGLITGRAGARWQPSFQVADPTTAIDRCAALGGRVLAGPIEIGLGRYVEMVDPLGSPFAVTSPVGRPIELAVAYNDVIGMELTFRG